MLTPFVEAGFTLADALLGIETIKKGFLTLRSARFTLADALGLVPQAGELVTYS